MLVKELGNDCETADDCKAGVAYSTCSAEGECICENGEQLYDHKGMEYCYQSKAGEYCSYSDDCLCE